MNTSLQDKRIAIVADWIKDWGGAEIVLEQTMELFPEADIFSSVFWQQENPLFQGRNITTSFIQKIPLLNKSHKLALTLRPLAFEGFDLSHYDIVISLSSAESKGVITKPDCLHVCYCHTPTRYFWSHYHEYLQMMEFGIWNPLAKWLMPKLVHRLRAWDFCAAQRPDYFIANSETTAKRIGKYYGREATVIYPGLDIKTSPLNQSSLLNNEKGVDEYYFYTGRCIPYKKFDLLVDAFNQNGKKLIIATNTNNTLYRSLKGKSKDNIEWKLTGDLDEINRLHAGAKAFLFPPEEDFGLAPVAAMMMGTPVIAYAKGGASESVVPKKNGVFFEEQTVSSLNEAIAYFETMKFDGKKIQKYAQKFSKKNFQEGLLSFIVHHLPK